MNKQTISRILFKILKKDLDFDIAYFPFEESKGHYKNVYKIISKDGIYILKKAKEKELDFYKFINNQTNCIPFFYGYVHLYNNDYILIEYFDGGNAMKMNREQLIRIIDTINNVQKQYWLSNDSFAITKEESLNRKNNAFSYLPNELKDTFSLFLDYYQKVPVTFSHEDLLPFNVLINKERVCFIDLEVGGILPYPTMLARLLAFTEEKDNALFYLKEEDYKFAIEYYYDSFIKEKGIAKKEYLLTMDLFIFNELTEWVWVYNKQGYKPNDFYNKWYQKAIMKMKEINAKLKE